MTCAHRYPWCNPGTPCATCRPKPAPGILARLRAWIRSVDFTVFPGGKVGW